MARTPVRNVRVPDDIWDALRLIALADDRSVSYIAVLAFREYLARVRAEADPVGAAPPRP